MDFKLVGFKKSGNEGKILTISHTANKNNANISLPLDIASGQYAGVFYSDLTLLPDKIYEFKFRTIGTSLKINLYLEDAYKRWNVYNTCDNSYYDYLDDSKQDVQVHHWRMTIPKIEKKSRLLSYKVNCLVHIVTDARELILYDSSIENAMQIKEIEPLQPLENLIHIIRNPTATSLEKHLSFMETIKSNFKTRINSIPFNKMMHMNDVFKSCLKDKSISILNSNSYIHSNWQQTYNNVNNYIMDKKWDVIVWSNTGNSIGLTSQFYNIQSPISQIATSDYSFLDTCYSFSYTACQFMCDIITRDVITRDNTTIYDAAFSKTLEHFSKRKTVYFCNPGLFLTCSNEEDEKIYQLYKNIKHGVYDMPILNTSLQTRVSVVVIIDNCIMSNPDEIDNCISSILNQNYRNIEILVANFSEYKYESKNVKVAILKTLHISDIIANCNGSYIMFHHFKTTSHTDRIEKQLQILVDSHNCLISVSSCGKKKLQLNGYELGLYKRSLFSQLKLCKTQCTSRNFSEVMYYLFSYIVFLECKSAVKRDSIISFTDFPFYFSLPEVLVDY